MFYKLLHALYRYYSEGKYSKDIPYFSSLIALFFTLMLNVVVLSFATGHNLLKYALIFDTEYEQLNKLVGVPILLLLFFVITKIIPKEKFINIEMSDKAYKKTLFIFFGYLWLSIIALIVFVIRHCLIHRGA